MFDWIRDWMKEAWEYLIPCVVIPYYDRGVRLRLGKPYGDTLEPGLHLKFPVIDIIHTHGEADHA